MRHLSSTQQSILLFLGLLLLIVLYFRFYHPPQPSPPEEVYREVVVEVLGDVSRPGLQLFRDPCSLRQVLEKAGAIEGGFPPDTASLSETIETGTLVTVNQGSAGEIRVKLGRMEARKLFVFSIPLDLNDVSVEDLCLIPGIGEAMAREIVAYRNRRKGFRSVEELRHVKGIGDKRWHSFKDYLTVKQD